MIAAVQGFAEPGDPDVLKRIKQEGSKQSEPKVYPAVWNSGRFRVDGYAETNIVRRSYYLREDLAQECLAQLRRLSAQGSWKVGHQRLEHTGSDETVASLDESFWVRFITRPQILLDGRPRINPPKGFVYIEIDQRYSASPLRRLLNRLGYGL